MNNTIASNTIKVTTLKIRALHELVASLETKSTDMLSPLFSVNDEADYDQYRQDYEAAIIPVYKVHIMALLKRIEHEIEDLSAGFAEYDDFYHPLV